MNALMELRALLEPEDYRNGRQLALVMPRLLRKILFIVAGRFQA